MTNRDQGDIASDLETWRETVPDVTIASAGKPHRVTVHVPHGDDVIVNLTAIRSPHVSAPQVDTHSIYRLDQLDIWHDPQNLEGELIGRATFEIPAHLPAGYYRLDLLSDQRAETSLVFITPHTPAEEANSFGVTLDLPTLRSRRSWGIGDLGDLAEFSVLAANWGSDFIHVQVAPELAGQFPGASLSPEGFLTPAERSRYMPPVLLRVEEIFELSYLPAPDRALIEWEAEEFHKRNATHDEINTQEIAQAKSAALELISAVELSPARQAEFSAFLEREGKALTNFALWAALAEECYRLDSAWPEDAEDPQAFGARRAQDRLANEIAHHQRLQWYLSEQFAAAHRRAQAAGGEIGLMRDLLWEPHADDLAAQAAWLAKNSTEVGGLFITVPNASELTARSRAVLAIEAYRRDIKVIVDVPNDETGQQEVSLAGIITTQRLWSDQAGAGCVQLEQLAPAQFLQIDTPLGMPLATYLADEFVDTARELVEEEQVQELRRSAANLHAELVGILGDRGFLEEDYSQRSLIESLHGWATQLPPHLTTFKLRDLVGQRQWTPHHRGLMPLVDAFGNPVVIDELAQMPLLRSLLRRL